MIDKLEFESDLEENRRFYQDLALDEAASVAFVLLKTRARDIDDGDSALENLPRIRDARQLAFIDAGGGVLESDRKMGSSIACTSNTKDRPVAVFGALNRSSGA